MSRPEKEIDWKKVEKMLQAQCLGTEIAAYFDMHPDTFYRRVKEKHGIGFTEYSRQKKDTGKMKLRMAQMKAALNGDKSMMVWLGKNYLDQKDKVEKEIKGGRVIKINITDEVQEKEESQDQENQEN